MDVERRFRRIFVIFFAPFVAIRIWAWLTMLRRRTTTQQQAQASDLRQRWEQLTTYEGKVSVLTRIALGPMLLTLVPLYIGAPQRVRQFTLPLPGWLRWFGAALGFSSLPLLAWTHQNLGREWSTNLELQQQHTLITSGPYRWMRHPMYTACLAFFAGSALTSANGVIIVPMSLASWVILARLKDEEAMMLMQFGEEYRAYQLHTGRFLPRLSEIQMR